MLGCRMGSEKVCEGRFYIHLDEFRQFSSLVAVSRARTKTAITLGELPFVVRLGRRTREDYPSRHKILLWFKNGQWHEYLVSYPTFPKLLKKLLCTLVLYVKRIYRSPFQQLYR